MYRTFFCTIILMKISVEHENVSFVFNDHSTVLVNEFLFIIILEFLMHFLYGIFHSVAGAVKNFHYNFLIKEDGKKLNSPRKTIPSVKIPSPLSFV